MRLDKYLKVSRLIKRRTVANKACDMSRVNVNGKPAKPSHDIKVGDFVEITLGGKTLKIEILIISEHALKDDTGNMYRVII